MENELETVSFGICISFIAEQWFPQIGGPWGSLPRIPG